MDKTNQLRKDNMRIRIRPRYCYSCDRLFENDQDSKNHRHPSGQLNKRRENRPIAPSPMPIPMNTLNQNIISIVPIYVIANPWRSNSTNNNQENVLPACSDTSNFKMKCMDCSKIFDNLPNLLYHVQQETRKPLVSNNMTPVQNNISNDPQPSKPASRPKRKTQTPKIPDHPPSPDQENNEIEFEPVLDDPDFDPIDEKIEPVTSSDDEISQDAPKEGISPKKSRTSKRTPPIFQIKTTIESPTPPQFPCSCGKTYPIRSFLIAHAERNGHDLPEEVQLFCPICPDKSVSFLKRPQLLEHLSSCHPSEKLHKCTMPNCSKSYARPADLRSHKLTRHKIQEEYKCSKCLECCTGYVKFQRHLSDHRKEDHIPKIPQLFPCPICCPEQEQEEGQEEGGEFKFKSLRQLKEHYLTNHPGQRIFACSDPNCMSSFWAESQRKVHEMALHDSPDNFPYKCQICNKGFIFKSRLTDHERSHTGVQPFLCPQCGKNFYTSKKCQAHIKGHEDKFECTVCKKVFNFKINLQRHMQRHEGFKRFMCSLCPKMYTQKVGLDHHMSVHTGVSRFKCQVEGCDKNFQNRIAREKHFLARHDPQGSSGVKKTRRRTPGPGPNSLPCPVCQKLLSNKFSLRDHMAKMHENYSEGMSLECEFCQKVFKSPIYLTKHLAHKHGIEGGDP